MWRATVVDSPAPGWVTVKVPSLYSEALIRGVQSAVPAEPGERVILADLNPTSRGHDWWVIGYESTVGRWGTPYAHTHPIGQIDGLQDALAGKANVEDIPDGADLSGYVTDAELGTALSSYATTTALSNGLAGKVNSSTYTTGMAGKANAPGPWVTCTPSTYITKLAGADIQARTTPDGIDIRSGRWRYAADVPRDSVIFTLPAGFAPSYQLMFMTSGMSASTNDYTAITVHLETRPDGTVTARSAHATSPTITLSASLMF